MDEPKIARHEPLPSTTCTGEDCSHEGPTHRAHPKFPCTCGMWYATARGWRQHYSRAMETERTLAEQREAKAALPRLQRLAKPHGLTVRLSPEGCRLDLMAPDGRLIAGNWCAASTAQFIQEFRGHRDD